MIYVECFILETHKLILDESLENKVQYLAQKTPILYILRKADITVSFSKHGATSYLYADDIHYIFKLSYMVHQQINLHWSPLWMCLPNAHDLHFWTSSNQLDYVLTLPRHNCSAMDFGTRQQLLNLPVPTNRFPSFTYSYSML